MDLNRFRPHPTDRPRNEETMNGGDGACMADHICMVVGKGQEFPARRAPATVSSPVLRMEWPLFEGSLFYRRLASVQVVSNYAE